MAKDCCTLLLCDDHNDVDRGRKSSLTWARSEGLEPSLLIRRHGLIVQDRPSPSAR